MMIDPDSFIVQRDPTTGSLKYYVPEEAMSRHFGLTPREPVSSPSPSQVIRTAGLTFAVASCLSIIATLWWMSPRGVDRYGPAFTEAGRVK
jgi:hypothetical protein